MTQNNRERYTVPLKNGVFFSPGTYFFNAVLISTKHAIWVGRFDVCQEIIIPVGWHCPPPTCLASASLCQLVNESTRHPLAVLHRNHWKGMVHESVPRGVMSLVVTVKK